MYTDPTLEDAYYSANYDYSYDYGDSGVGTEHEGTRNREEEVDPSQQCVYSGWEDWSNCSSDCGSGTKSRSRSVLQGADCPYVNHTTSCFGRACSLDLNVVVRERATLLPAKYGKGRNKKEYEVRSNLKNFTEEENTELYCVHFQEYMNYFYA